MTTHIMLDQDVGCAKYADLCNWFWYHSHPDYPRDGLRHTSSECRSWAFEVFELLGITDRPERPIGTYSPTRAGERENETEE